MRRIALLSIVLVLCFATSSFAAYKAGGTGVTIDGALAVATETASGSGAGMGVSLGASYDLEKLVKIEQGKFLLRADFSYFSGSQDAFGATLDSSRMPLFVGARYVLPLSIEPIELYAEAGMELSFDKHDVAIPFFFGFKQSVSETNLGFSPGIGVKFPVAGNFSLGADARFHVIKNSYTSFMLSVGYTF